MEVSTQKKKEDGQREGERKKLPKIHDYARDIAYFIGSFNQLLM
jgi:hypothetical protein